MTRACVIRPRHGLAALLILGCVLTGAGRAQEGTAAHAGAVTIPAGEFWMGRTRLWLMDEIGWQIRERYDDRPVHRVRLPAFTIDSHEVTSSDYAEFASSPSSGVEPPYHWGGPRPPAGKERLPVYNVTWFEAAK